MTACLQALLSASGSAAVVERVRIHDADIAVSEPGGPTATAFFKIGADGNVYGPNGTIEDWLLEGGVSEYEVRATKTSGSALTAGTINAWLSLSSDRQWTLSAGLSKAGGIEKVCTLLIEVRDASSGTLVDSATVSLAASTV